MEHRTREKQTLPMAFSNKKTKQNLSESGLENEAATSLNSLYLNLWKRSAEQIFFILY